MRPELAIEGEAPAMMAARLALAKARSIDTPEALVIGSDQVASLNRQLLRKPGDHATAVRQLEACQGRTVIFDTAVAVIDTRTWRTPLEHVDRTEVRFATLENRGAGPLCAAASNLSTALAASNPKGSAWRCSKRIDSSDFRRP